MDARDSLSRVLRDLKEPDNVTVTTKISGFSNRIIIPLNCMGYETLQQKLNYLHENR